MKNRVNLYPRELRPTYDLLTLGFALGLWLAAALIIGFWQWQMHQQWTVLQAQEQATATQLAGLRTQVKRQVQQLDREPSQALVEQIQLLQRQIAAQQEVLAMLAQRERTDKPGYASLMDDLARLHHPDIWLTHINMTDDRIQLEGGTRTAEALPQWLSLLSQGNSLTGTEFATVQLIRDEQENLGFVLSSTAADTIRESRQ